MQALLRRQVQQEQDRAKAAELWQETDLVFSTTIGTTIDAHNLRRDFRKLCRAAGIRRHVVATRVTAHVRQHHVGGGRTA